MVGHALLALCFSEVAPLSLVYAYTQRPAIPAKTEEYSISVSRTRPGPVGERARTAVIMLPGRRGPDCHADWFHRTRKNGFGHGAQFAARRPPGGRLQSQPREGGSAGRRGARAPPIHPPMPAANPKRSSRCWPTIPPSSRLSSAKMAWPPRWPKAPSISRAAPSARRWRGGSPPNTPGVDRDT